MSDDRNEQNNLMDEQLGELRGIQISSSPSFKKKVLEELHENVSLRKKLRNWKVFSTAAVLMLGSALFNQMPGQDPNIQKVAMNQPYVIHLQLDGEDIQLATNAEIELPDGVHFVSKSHPKIQGEKRLRLPLSLARENGRSRLPFVVQSTIGGVQAIKIRFFSEERLVSEKVLSVKFTEWKKAEREQG